MLLTRALRLREREVVAFVGGGGKTTAMFRLAQEIVTGGGRVVTTTTTRIFAAQIRLAPFHLFVLPDGRLPDEFEEALEVHRHILLTGAVDEAEGKARAAPLNLIAELSRRSDLTAILLEADGSRMRPLKAPAEHEPVIPPQATLIVPLVGVDVLGRPLDDVHTHRPELIRGLISTADTPIVTPEVVAEVLAHARGGRKDVPAGARVLPLVNKVEGASRLAGGRHVADLLVQRHGFDSVALAAVGSKSADEPVIEVRSRTAALVLAAGEAKRMGQLKQLLPWGDTTLVGHAVDVALASQADEVIVVVGCQAERVAAAVADRPARVVVNPDWPQGQSTSVRAGLAALSPGTQVAIFTLVDQPQIPSRLIDALIQRHRETLAPIVAPRVDGQRANPVLFDVSTWPQLAALTGDTGGRELFAAHAERVAWVDWDESILGDLDTPEDFARARRAVGGSSRLSEEP